MAEASERKSGEGVGSKSAILQTMIPRGYWLHCLAHYCCCCEMAVCHSTGISPLESRNRNWGGEKKKSMIEEVEDEAKKTGYSEVHVTLLKTPKVWLPSVSLHLQVKPDKVW